jgi:hypothetical protein
VHAALGERLKARAARDLEPLAIARVEVLPPRTW